MQQVTVNLQDSVAEWLKDWALRHHTSISRMLGEMLAEKMRTEDEYAAAMNEFLAVEASVLSSESSAERPYPSRDAAHER